MTAQSMEILFIDSVEHGMRTLPLERFHADWQRETAPVFRYASNFVSLTDSGQADVALEPWLEAQTPPVDREQLNRCFSTALWRRYLGHWRIADDQLLLDRLTSDIDGYDLDIRRLFGDRPAPIAADWFTGKLRLPGEPRLLYVHMGWDTMYQYERIIHVRAGRVIRERQVDHTARFLAEFASLRQRLRDEGRDVETEPRHHGLSWLTEEGQRLLEDHFGFRFPEEDEAAV